MEQMTLITPTFLFSAVSLILLAYTNRFLSYAQVVRALSAQHHENPSATIPGQIRNLRLRLRLTRAMQVFGIGSLFLCVASMFFIYVGFQMTAAIMFGIALLLLIASLGVSIWEIMISVRALDIYLDGMETDKPIERD